LRVPFSVFCFFVIFVDSIIGPTSCGEGEKSARAKIRDARVRRYLDQGVTMSLSTLFETGPVFDPGPQPGHGPYYTVVRPVVRCCLGGEMGRCSVGSGLA